MEYQDVITKEAEAVKIVKQEEWEMFHDKRYMPIIKALRIGPMTVRDLEEEYNKIVEAQIDELDLTKKEKKELLEKTKRKGKTLYKYLDILVKNNVLVEAGKRIRPGQTASETLYGRTAKLFILSDKNMDDKLFFSHDKTWEVIGTIIRTEKNKKDIDISCLEKVFLNIAESSVANREDIFTKYSDILSEHSPNITFEELNRIAWIFEIFHYISSASEFNKDIEACFK